MSVIISDATYRTDCGLVAEEVCKLQTQRTLEPSAYFCWKPALDWALALLLLVPAIPLIALLAVIVRLTSRGPAIFSQLRVGKNGRTFTMYKIRTMRQDAEAKTGPVWSQIRDPRTTPLGALLRTLHLDELPQLWNVLSGEMSLIGPRPERPEFVRVLTEAIPAYSERMLVRPGITGLAQLNLPPDTDLESVCRKLVLDCEYIETAGLWLDFRIFSCTLLRIFKLRASWLMRLCALRRAATIAARLDEVADTDGCASGEAEPTPVSILIQTSSATRSCEGDCHGLFEAGAAPGGNGHANIDLAARGKGSPEAGPDRPLDVLNAFTVDVEDYFQVSAFERHIGRGQWDQWESRVAPNTQRMLALLDRHGVKATFFILGWVAERYPGLVRDIQACGHEIGSHGHWHRLIYEQTPAEFRDDLRRSLAVLQDTTGQAVRAYRAPSFSITSRSLWALPILVEEGIVLDSSVFPIRHDRYGIPGAQRRPHRLTTPAGPLWELPPSVVSFAGMNVPVCGGGYFRLFPLAWSLYCLRRINCREQQPFVFYVHPWELDPEQPRIRAASRLTRFRHYVNLSANERKLDVLLRTFQFGRLSETLDDMLGLGETVPNCSVKPR